MIEEAARATGRSIRSLAANAGLSDTRWRQIVKGWQPGPDGTKLEVHAPAMTLAKMAIVVGLEPEQLAQTGRTDAADLVGRFGDLAKTDSITSDVSTTEAFREAVANYRAARGATWQRLAELAQGSYPHGTVVRPVTDVDLVPLSDNPDEIDLIYASRMSAREKLLRIRQVLELRALAEAEEAERHKDAPAEAGADEQETRQS